MEKRTNIHIPMMNFDKTFMEKIDDLPLWNGARSFAFFFSKPFWVISPRMDLEI